MSRLMLETRIPRVMIKNKHKSALVGSSDSLVVHWVSHDEQITIGCLLVHGCFDGKKASCALATAVGTWSELELCDVASN